MMRVPQFKLQTLMLIVATFAGWLGLFHVYPVAMFVFPVGALLFVLLLFEMSLDDGRDRETRVLYRVYRWIGFSGVAAWVLQLAVPWKQLFKLLGGPP
jgi:hypothetical protein